MSLFIDRKYIGMIAHRLPLFKQKKDNLYTFRCTYCGDSKKSKIKTRGFLYVKDNSFFFRCFNCSESHTFSNFLKTIDPNLHKKYILERYSNGENKNSNYKQPVKKDLYLDSKPKFTKKVIKIPSIEELPKNHFCRNYVENVRLIPQEYFKILYFAKDFNDFVEKMVPGKYKNLGNSPKLIIPFFDKNGKLFAFQARSLFGENPKYITLKIDDNEPKIYGLERVDLTKKIYVVEGPLDSLFLRNAIAAAGSDLPTSINPENCVFIFDNEARSREITNKMNQIINKKYSIYIPPANLKQYGKDINAIIQFGWYGSEEVQRVIDNNTYKGLEAEIQMAKWSKV